MCLLKLLPEHMHAFDTVWW